MLTDQARRLLTGTVMGATLLTAAIDTAHGGDAADRVVTVMTRNVYHGVDAEFAQAASATTFFQFLTAVGATFQGYHARNFPERAAALAAEIDATRPDLIGLQEVVMVRTDQTPPTLDGPATPAEAVSLDYLQILLAALAARGLHYAPVITLTGLDIEAPSILGFDVRHTDREVILARTDLKTSDLKLSNAQAGYFTANCVLSTALGPVVIKRGWISVDAKVRGKSFRFVSTHLDGDCSDPAIQESQAAELLAGPAATTLPVVLVGDLNSKADGTGTASYADLLAAGFEDAWKVAGVGAGFTCCQDDHVLNATSILSDRRDFVLFRGTFEVLGVDIVGEDPANRTPSGLWPSDHAGVVATLTVPRPGRGK